jgi:hypothetical protein
VAIEDGHENRDAASGSGGRFGSRADRQDGSVGGGNDGLFAALRGPLGVPEELKQKEENEKTENGQCGLADQLCDRTGRQGGGQEGPSFPGDGYLQCVIPPR